MTGLGSAWNNECRVRGTTRSACAVCACLEHFTGLQRRMQSALLATPYQPAESNTYKRGEKANARVSLVHGSFFTGWPAMARIHEPHTLPTENPCASYGEGERTVQCSSQDPDHTPQVCEADSERIHMYRHPAMIGPQMSEQRTCLQIPAVSLVVACARENGWGRQTQARRINGALGQALKRVRDHSGRGSRGTGQHCLGKAAP